jgi:hypothetical protein
LRRRQQPETEKRERANGGDEARFPAARALQRGAADRREPKNEQIEKRLADDGEKLRPA